MIITDCAMPLLSGAELIARIRRREQRSAHRTVLVALTADATEAQRRACLQAGADEVCLKPLSLAQLRELLARFGLAEPAPTPASTALYDDLQPQLRRMLADDLASLRGLSSDTDKEKTREVAHAIAGAAAWFQLPEVAEAAQRLQRCLDEGRPARAALVALSDAIERALNASGVAPTQGVGGTEIGGK
jgi:two-component system sensor histidine kinase EvgS